MLEETSNGSKWLLSATESKRHSLTDSGKPFECKSGVANLQLRFFVTALQNGSLIVKSFENLN